MRTTLLASLLFVGLTGTAFAETVCQGTYGSAKVSTDPSTIKAKDPRAGLYACKMQVGGKRLDFCTKAATGNDKPEKIDVKIEYGDPKKPMTDTMKVDCKKKT